MSGSHLKGKRFRPWAALVCQQCGSVYEVEPYRSNKSRYCSWQCGQKAKALASAAINGPKLRGGGAGKTYLKFNGRHLHRVVAEQKLGRKLIPGEIVHHINGNKRDNRPENLEVLSSQSSHAKHHFPEMMQARLIKAGY